ncbi:MAG TPA: imidazole glycerol phosphate synthase subunit HisH [Acidimicrobiia bacterium]|jgi:glutamine amidotransferase|nr:imidazole glycerol phosphate synthase subunit HisH [Acidimicrobiia bacterium]
MIAVLDYGIGNLRSAEKALQHLGVAAALTTDPAIARQAAGVVLPGVGAFGPCMEQLRESGLEGVVHEAVEAGKPFLGICVGMQMLFDSSEEAPGCKGLGIFAGEVRRLRTTERLPHMGWNTLTIRQGSILFDGLSDGSWLYFVHSYAPVPDDDAVVAATTDYGGPVVAAVERDHVWATQFHPEKSAGNGLRLLQNFAAACG